MRQLQHKVVSALSIGFVGCLSFRDKDHPHNKVACPEFAPFMTERHQWYRECHNQLLFLCALHRLQQLPPGAVLARLHSIFSKCCRFDLLLLTTRFARRRCAAGEAVDHEPEAHADDILTAFGAMQWNMVYMPMMDDMHVSDRLEIKQSIGSMVDAWVDMGSVWNNLGALLDLPIYNTRC